MLDMVVSFAQQHWTEVGSSIASLIIGALLGRWRGWLRFARRAFFDRITVSLNFVEDGQLVIRTLIERAGAEVFRNSEMLRIVMRAARNGKGALLDLPADDYWYYLNSVLNAVSEHFAEGYVRQEAGLGAAPQTYLLFLTCEREGRVRQQKVRAMLIRESLLLQTDSVRPHFHNEFHESRWNTLKTVRDEWVSSGGQTPRIRKISICV